jgi:hypothetical protein
LSKSDNFHFSLRSTNTCYVQQIGDENGPDKSCGKRLLVIIAQRPISIPYHEYEGRAWIRQGSEKRLLTLTEKDHLRRTRDRAFHPGPWKCDRCGSWVGQLSIVTLTAEGPKKTYDCHCGGQFWSST